MGFTAWRATLLLLLAPAACGDSGPMADPSGTNVPVQGVKVTPQVVQLLAIGETRQIVATIAPANATDQAITWESSDPSVASVDPAGLVTANAAGAGVFITAYTHDGHHEASVNVTVILDQAAIR